MIGLLTRPRRLARLESMAMLALALIGYRRAGGRWRPWLRLFLVPDLSWVGYLSDARRGAATYNAAHTYVPPLMLGAYGVLAERPHLLRLALTWVAHIALDRSLGWGLKEPTSFFDTHLDRALAPERLARASGWLSLLFAVALLGAPRRTAALLGLQQGRAVAYALGVRDVVLAWGLVRCPHAAWQAARAASDVVDSLLLIASAGRDPSLRLRGTVSAALAALFSLLGWWNALRLARHGTDDHGTAHDA